jgi:hypothetical protein
MNDINSAKAIKIPVPQFSFFMISIFMRPPALGQAAAVVLIKASWA